MTGYIPKDGQYYIMWSFIVQLFTKHNTRLIKSKDKTGMASNTHKKV
jgi:hypothetical protein